MNTQCLRDRLSSNGNCQNTMLDLRNQPLSNERKRYSRNIQRIYLYKNILISNSQVRCILFIIKFHYSKQCLYQKIFICNPKARAFINTQANGFFIYNYNTLLNQFPDSWAYYTFSYDLDFQFIVLGSNYKIDFYPYQSTNLGLNVTKTISLDFTKKIDYFWMDFSYLKFYVVYKEERKIDIYQMVIQYQQSNVQINCVYYIPTFPNPQSVQLDVQANYIRVMLLWSISYYRRDNHTLLTNGCILELNNVQNESVNKTHIIISKSIKFLNIKVNYFIYNQLINLSGDIWNYNFNLNINQISVSNQQICSLFINNPLIRFQVENSLLQIQNYFTDLGNIQSYPIVVIQGAEFLYYSDKLKNLKALVVYQGDQINSVLLLLNDSFSKNSLQTMNIKSTYICISSQSSRITLNPETKENKFYNVTISQQQPNIPSYTSIQITQINNAFFKVQMYSNSTLISFQQIGYLQINNLTLKNVIILSNTSNSQSILTNQIFIIDKVQQLQVLRSTFINIKSQIRSVIFELIQNLQCVFQKLTVDQLNNAQFIKNQNYGQSTQLTSIETQDTFKIANSLFSNYLSDINSLICYQKSLLNVSNTTFQNSNINLNQQLNSNKLFKFQKNINQSSLFTLTNIQSGGFLNLSFQLLDEEGNIVTFDHQNCLKKMYPQDLSNEIEQININLISQDDSKMRLLGSYITKYSEFITQNKTFQINGVQLVGNPLSNQTMLVYVSGIVTYSSNLQISTLGPYYAEVQVQFRYCLMGEIFEQSNDFYECSPCPFGTYSIQKPIIMQQMSQEAQFCQQNQTTLSKGYWKSSNFSDIIYSCTQIINCDGNQTTNYCSVRHAGPLCQFCYEQGIIWGGQYQCTGQNKCDLCSGQSQTKSLGVAFLICLGLIIYCVINIFTMMASGKKKSQSYYLRKIKLASVSNSCYKQIQLNMSIKLLSNCIQMLKIMSTQTLQFPVSITIVPDLFGISCVQFDGQKYIQLDYTYEYYAETHLKFLYYLLIPSLIFYIIIVLGIILKKISINKNNLDYATIRQRYGYIYQGYYKIGFYWEFIRFAVQLIIIFNQNLETISSNTRCFLIMGILIVYYIALSARKPFMMKKYQRVEEQSTIALIFISVLNLALDNNSSSSQSFAFQVIRYVPYYTNIDCLQPRPSNNKSKFGTIYEQQNSIFRQASVFSNDSYSLKQPQDTIESGINTLFSKPLETLELELKTKNNPYLQKSTKGKPKQ
ncbi:hypothetical protein ABPG72_009251 [Tetrahymena utriculariae]